MTIPAGQLNKRITVERRTAGQDELGQPVETWTQLLTQRAAIKTLGSAETYTKTGELATFTDEIKIRYNSVSATITRDDRVLNNQTGDYYDIVRIENKLAHDRILILHCNYRSRGVT